MELILSYNSLKGGEKLENNVDKACLIGPLIIVFVGIIVGFATVALPEEPLIFSDGEYGITPTAVALITTLVILISGTLASFYSHGKYPYLQSCCAVVFFVLNYVSLSVLTSFGELSSPLIIVAAILTFGVIAYQPEKEKE